MTHSYVENGRAALNFIEDRHLVPTDEDDYFVSIDIATYAKPLIRVFVRNDTDDNSVLRTLRRRIGAMDKVDNKYSGMYLEQKNEDFIVQLHPTSGTCNKVQVGTKTVEKPDPNAPTVTVEEPVYEWQCPDVLNGAE